ncbi:ABC transporter substrate-binding protein [Gulosibacter sp. ACHW.36C]|uniref:ABC transporter substrate-binding protein n=1 Tax=Gulosibacter sediminis TaxID=1729695 RepID=A0ABY4MUU2_9MICO|nr:ABC transporter substrate-binding protein [Gulosibacter sediminis]UQN13932.1 ABC transporter substrate-binding protein [Gulosibacter sediminis]
MQHRRIRAGIGAIAALAVATALAGCASGDPLDTPAESGTAAAGDTIVVGSQTYYSNEIIAEIYAQALEANGFTVDRSFNSGQRDAYMPEIENGNITLFPEYTGNLLQYLDPEATERESEEVYTALEAALPDGLQVLDQAEASDQDSYTVTQEFAQEYELESIADLAGVEEQLTLGGPPELADRPYGPKGLAETYGVDVEFSATGDTTVEDLLAGTVNVANVFTADPRIETDSLVVLADPESLFLASQVVPVASAELDPAAADIINEVSAKLTAEDLVVMNVQSTEDQASTPDIASEWLEQAGLNG